MYITLKNLNIVFISVPIPTKVKLIHYFYEIFIIPTKMFR